MRTFKIIRLSFITFSFRYLNRLVIIKYNFLNVYNAAKVILLEIYDIYAIYIFLLQYSVQV